MVYETERAVLEIFENSTKDIVNQEDFVEKRQKIKQLFYHRQYLDIFSDPELVSVYAAEYPPSRALCYANLFLNDPQLSQILLSSSDLLCLGAGAGSEMVAISVAHSILKSEKHSQLRITCQDIADYTHILNLFEEQLRVQYPTCNVSFQHQVYDLLEPQYSDKLVSEIAQSQLITAMFLLNELLASSKAGFVKLIGKIVENMKQGSYFLVVDSAGSFSELDVNGKSYKCFLLLDHVKAFECVLSQDAQWYRFPEELRYPLKLNNMRYYLRLYRKI